MKCLLSFLFIFSLSLKVVCQVSSSFSGISNACLQQNIYLNNTSQNASRYEWDFAPYDSDSLLVDQNIATLPGLSGGYGCKIIEDNGIWFGFVASQGNNSIYRLDYGNSPLNTPTVVALGNPNGILELPTNIEIYKNGNNWYGFVGLFNPNAGIARLDFGNSLTNSPTAQNLGMFGQSGRFWDIKVIEENGNLALVMPLRNGSSSLVVVNYRDSFDNSISNATDVFNSGTFGDLGIATSVDLIPSGQDWIALVTSNSSNTIIQFRYNSTIFSTPIEENTFSNGLNKPLNVRVVQEGSRYVAAVTNENTNLKLIDFHDFNPVNSPILLSHSSLSSLLGIAACRYKGKTIVQGAGLIGNQARGMIFKSYTDAPSDYTESATPNSFSYSKAGTKDIELRAFDSQDLFSTSSVQIIVSSSTSPDITFTSQNNCVGNNINFNSSNQSGNISSLSWDFNDGGSATGNVTSHSFSSVGSYNVVLTATGSNGCQNSYQQILPVFNIPQANFYLPQASPFCTNQNYVFTNTTSFDLGSNPTWQWTVNGLNVSSTKDLSYLFSSTAAQTISLTASIPGCSSQSTQQINSLSDGPLVKFASANTGCVSSSIPFTNNTTGTVTSYLWSFGDGNNSSQTNASNSFSSTGSYSVMLTASNAAGCINSFSKNISIYSNPQPNFQTELPPLSCAKSPTQFDNLTPAPTDSNISSWLWSFGDASNGTSTSKNPAYTYSSAGNYNVTLQATTNFGCTNSIQKPITISQSPQAGFTNLPACVNQSTQFTDASTGNITFYQWTIQKSVLQGTAPTYTFNASGTYAVTLTVTGSNGCLNQITKNIVVPVLPIVDFTVQAPCTGEPTIFQELNPGGSDPAVAWNWNFGSASSTSAVASYQFLIENGYTVTMSSTRQSGCVYSVSKNISIVAGPVASFTPSAFAGAAPLSVTFENNSTADNYFWQFGDADNTTSTDTSPTFVYNTLGSYKALLTAKNYLGCADTMSTEIDVVVPRIDLVMNNFSLSNDPSSNSTKATVTILNSGNIPLVDPEVEIDLGGGAIIKESVSGMIRPGKSLTQTLGLQIVPQSLSYICAIVEATDDADFANNKQCVSLSAEDIVMAPYPNPTNTGSVNFDWISSAEENVEVTIYKSNGEVAFHQTINLVATGLSQMSINTSAFSNGLYLVQFAGSKTKKTYRFIVAN